MAFIDASLEMSKTNQLLWTLDYGFSSYSENWKTGYGSYIRQRRDWFPGFCIGSRYLGILPEENI